MATATKRHFHLGGSYLGSSHTLGGGFVDFIPPVPQPTPVEVGGYRFSFYDLRTNELIEELSLPGATYERGYEPGSWSAQVSLLDEAIQKKSIPSRLQRGRTLIVIDRDTAPVYAGILWNHSYNSADKTLGIGGEEVLSYLDVRALATDHIWVNEDKFEIVRDVVNYAQSITGGNIGIRIPDAAMSGVVMTLKYPGRERKIAGSIIDELIESGIDVSVQIGRGAGSAPDKVLQLWYPRRGRPYSQTGLTFEKPGAILDYSTSGDGKEEATNVYGLGAGEGARQLSSTSTNTALIDGGHTLIDKVASFPDVKVQSLLNALTAEELALSQSLSQTPPATWQINPTVAPQFGSYDIGDDCVFKVMPDEYFETGFSAELRIASISVTTPTDSDPEKVAIATGRTE